MAKKEKMVQLTNPKPGDKCVVADFVGTVIYTIKSIEGEGLRGFATLEYPVKDGKMVGGGVHPLYCCYVPTKAQLAAPQD